jgi:hypothetical protein
VIENLLPDPANTDLLQPQTTANVSGILAYQCTAAEAEEALYSSSETGSSNHGTASESHLTNTTVPCDPYGPDDFTFVDDSWLPTEDEEEDDGDDEDNEDEEEDM